MAELIEIKVPDIGDFDEVEIIEVWNILVKISMMDVCFNYGFSIQVIS